MKLIFIAFFIIFHVQVSIANGTFILEDDSNGNISLQAKDANLLSLLAQIHDRTGIKFVIEKPINKDAIFIDLQRVDINKAINRLLKHYNKTFEYDESGKIKVVYIKPENTQVKLVQQSVFPQAEVVKLSTPQPSNKYVATEEVNLDNSNLLEETSPKQAALTSNNTAYIDEDVLEMFVDNSTQVEPPGTIAPNTAHVEMEVSEFTGTAPGKD
jgi:type II secretory pathway component GspD/PulD (secretin)